MAPYPEALKCLDELIRDLDDRADTPQGLVREHLATARACLLESAQEEYELMLEMAEEALPQLRQSALRKRIAEFLERRNPAL